MGDQFTPRQALQLINDVQQALFVGSTLTPKAVQDLSIAVATLAGVIQDQDKNNTPNETPTEEAN